MKNGMLYEDWLIYYWSTYIGTLAVPGNPLWYSTMNAMEIIE